MFKNLFTTLRHYKFAWLGKDVLAGIMVATVTIPIAMGYAEVAGLPPIYGLYASVFPVIAYAIFSSSRQLIFGIDAATSAITGSAIGILILSTGQNALTIAPILSLFVGIFLFVFAVLKFGRFATYLSEPVMSGFISGMAIAIIVGQIPKILGLPSAGTDFLKNILTIISDSGMINLPSLVLGISVVILILIGRHITPRLPLALFVLICVTFITYHFQLESLGVKIVGTIPSGLPSLSFPNLLLPDIIHIASVGFAIAIIVASDSLLSARSFASKNRYKLRDNQELFAFGVSNTFASLSGTSPTSSSVSRTAVSEQYKGKTQLVAIIAASIVAVIIALFSQVLYYLPIPALAGVVVCALLHLVDVRASLTLKKHSKAEFTIWLVAALGILLVGILFGVIMAILLSFADFIRRASTPSQAILGRIEGRRGHFDISRHKKAKSIDGILIYRFSAPLFFGNSQLFKQSILNIIKTTHPPVKIIIIDASGITNIDSTAASTLKKLLRRLSKMDIDLCVARSIGPVNDKFEKFGISKKVSFYKTIREAVTAAEDQQNSF